MQSCINNCMRYAFWSFLRPPTWWMLSKASKHVTKVRYYWLGVWYSLINLQNAEWLPIFTIHGKEVVAWHVLCQTCGPTNTICRPSLPMPISTCITWPASVPWRSTRSTLTLKADSQQEVFGHEHLTWKNAKVDEQMKTSISSFSIGKILIGTQTLQDLEMPMDKYQIANLDGAWVVSQNNVVTLCRNSRFYAPSLVTGTNCLRTVWQLLISNFGRIVRVNGGNWSFSGSMWQ